MDSWSWKAEGKLSYSVLRGTVCAVQDIRAKEHTATSPGTHSPSLGTHRYTPLNLSWEYQSQRL